MLTKDLSFLIGKRFFSLGKLEQAIESATGRPVKCIESMTEYEDADFIIDYEYQDKEGYGHVDELYYLKDNAGNYYITEV